MNDEVKTSGQMQEFSTGAHRDNSVGKGRCDLIPLSAAALVMFDDPVLSNIDMFMDCHDVSYLAEAIRASASTVDRFQFANVKQLMEESGVELNTPVGGITKAELANMMLEVSKLYEQGARLYGANNWKLGMPVERYIDSGVRHYLKTLRGDADEAHYRGFIWNMLCAMWTEENKPK